MRLLSWIYVPKCTVCRKRLDVTRDITLCDECLLKWEREKDGKCPTCGQSSRDCWCGIPSDSHKRIYAERHLSYYASHSESVTKSMILAMKKRMTLPLAQMFSQELAELVSESILNDADLIVNVPRSHNSVRKYGFDQTLILAQGISKILNKPLVQILLHKGKTMQKSLRYEERMQNARKSYELPQENKDLIKGKSVILLDDVVTTGATVTRCASLLKRAGAKRIYVLCIAKAYR